MMESYAPITDGKLYLRIQGKGNPLVFIHADGLDSRMWSDQADYFSGYYQVLTFDLRSFGNSSLPGLKKYSFYDDLRQLLNYLKLRAVNLVGLSMGASVCLSFSLAYPNYVKTVTLANPGISGRKLSADFNRIWTEVKNIAQSGDLNKARLYWLNQEFSRLKNGGPQNSSLIETMISETSGYRWYGSNQPQTLKPPASERLNEISCPALVISSEGDEPDFKANAAFLNEKIPDSRLEVIRNSGHLSNLDNPKEFNRILFKFLQKYG